MTSVWVLTFFLTVGGGPFEAGEYLSRERCERGARMQLAHWQRTYPKARVTWACSRWL